MQRNSLRQRCEQSYHISMQAVASHYTMYSAQSASAFMRSILFFLASHMDDFLSTFLSSTVVIFCACCSLCTVAQVIPCPPPATCSSFSCISNRMHTYSSIYWLVNCSRACRHTTFLLLQSQTRLAAPVKGTSAFAAALRQRFLLCSGQRIPHMHVHIHMALSCSCGKHVMLQG